MARSSKIVQTPPGKDGGQILNPADTENILTAGENLHIEFKEAHDRLRGTHQLAGLANRKLSLFPNNGWCPT
jgi:hypothetical protein